MDDNGKQRINDYFKANSTFKSKVLALRNKWLPVQNKSFGLWDALGCIYDYANGNLLVMTDILTHLTNEKKQGTFGRANAAYGVETHPKIDIIRDANGNLELVGYNTNDPLTLKGQHDVGTDPNRLKKDGTTKKIVINKEKSLADVGAIVRKIYPNADKGWIEMVDAAILKNAEIMHKSPLWVATQLLKGKLKFSEKNMDIVKNESVERKIIVITESAAQMLQDEFGMTEYKFNSSIKKFLHDLLVDPINAIVPSVLKFNGLNRGKLLKYLSDNDIIVKDQKIHDKDENGNPVTATMKVKYNVPKKNFDRKLKKLYIKLFEKNVPDIGYKSQEEDSIEEMTGCCGGTDAMGGKGADGGAFIAPAFQDKEVIRRGDGEGGSNSIYHV